MVGDVDDVVGVCEGEGEGEGVVGAALLAAREGGVADELVLVVAHREATAHPAPHPTVQHVLHRVHQRLHPCNTTHHNMQSSQTRIEETFGFKKRFHFSAFMQDKLSMQLEQRIKETMDKRIFAAL